MSAKESSRQRHDITIRQFAEEIMPDWEPDDWFIWPPDVFALTSLLLKTTGIYRYAVSPHPKEKKRCGWFEKDNEASKTSIEWYKWILGLPHSSFPEALRKSKEILFDERNRINLYSFDISPEACTAILHLHAVADTAGANFGLPNAPGTRVKQIHFLANTLLGLTGTLSRLPRRHGVVLPKMRAPQSGLTIRHFSHHLTFHQSEMDIHWRTIPWNNRDYNTVNIMAVPMPYKVTSRLFRPCPYPGQENDAKNFDYFEYASDERLDAGEVVALLRKAHAEMERVHILVFPEAALTRNDLDDLKSALQSEIKSPHQIPMIITGLRGGSDGTEKRNQVVLSVFFANKWYDLRQDKHHRWKLDADQIKRYSLAASLNVQNQWWEGIDLRDRSLTFLAPNGWLTLCPLICEDLAQLEPVSDLIRGVGPTLVVAILMDGPQLTDRWSARYVGVLADDPGTSVLTITSLGMALRSRVSGRPEDRTVALWKDRETGWEPIKLKEGAEAILLTISAKWNEEFTADGRSDHMSAATFILRGTLNLQVSEEEKEEARKDVGARQKRLETSGSTDVLELSIMSYLVDIVMDIPGSLIDRICNWAIDKEDARHRRDSVRKTLRPFKSLEERLKAGIGLYASKRGEWPPPQYRYGVIQLSNFMRPENEHIKVSVKEEPRQKLERWKRLVEKADASLAREQAPQPAEDDGAREGGISLADKRRLNRLVYLAVLWAVRNRLENRKHNRTKRRAEETPDRELEKAFDELLRDTERCQEKYSGYDQEPHASADDVVGGDAPAVL